MLIRRRKMRLYKGEFLDILKTIAMLRVAKGDYVKKFEEEFAKYIGTKYAIATYAGRNGLELLLEALGLKKGDEVILPAYTLKDLVFLIKSKGFVPVIVDIEEDAYNINAELAKEVITERTKVIIATHIFGFPCNMDSLIDIAKIHNTAIIEDCAHAAGAEFKGRKVGSFGKAAFFSFETIKPINTFGGGMITTDDDVIAQYVTEKINSYPYEGKKIVLKIIYSYFEHFILHSPVYLFIALLFRSEHLTKIISSIYLFIHKKSRISNFRYSNLQALLGLRQLKELEGRNALRREKAEILTGFLKKNIAVQRIIPYTKPIYYFFVINAGLQFRHVRKELFKKGVDIGTGSEITDNCSKIQVDCHCPAVEMVYEHAVQLPLYDELGEGDIEYIAECVNAL